MNFKNLLATAVLTLSALGNAQANQLWNWSYTGTGVAAAGTMTTAGPALSFEDILSITGVRNGQAITGLIPVGDDPDFSYDNQFSAVGENFTIFGVLFGVVNGQSNVNVYVDGGTYIDLVVDGLTPIEIPITFTVTAVPEPATVLSMAFGLGLLGVYARRRAGTA